MWWLFRRFRRKRDIGIALIAAGVIIVIAAAPIWFWPMLIGLALCAAGLYLLFLC